MFLHIKILKNPIERLKLIRIEELMTFRLSEDFIDVVEVEGEGKFFLFQMTSGEDELGVFVVPFLETEEGIIVKTLFYSRKASIKYLRTQDRTRETNDGFENGKWKSLRSKMPYYRHIAALNLDLPQRIHMNLVNLRRFLSKGEHSHKYYKIVNAVLDDAYICFLLKILIVEKIVLEDGLFALNLAAKSIARRIHTH